MSHWRYLFPQNVYTSQSQYPINFWFPSNQSQTVHDKRGDLIAEWLENARMVILLVHSIKRNSSNNMLMKAKFILQKQLKIYSAAW